VLANVEYWMRDFHVDGFRLDATHEIYDHSPRHVLQEVTAAIHAVGGYAIAEDSRNEVRVVLPVDKGGLGFDAVWADDFHHIVRVGQTQEAEGYLSEFAGTPGELLDTLRHGWHYRGQVSKFTLRARGTECQDAPPQAFLHCLSNHDQTGNDPFGRRIGHRVQPEAMRAAEMLLCLSPYTPMLFMGQEWNASTPFLFFVDHQAELNRLLAEGRREEFKHFSAFSDPAVLNQIPLAQDPGSFTASKLAWNEREQPAHAATLALYRACLELRHHHAAFRPASRDTWKVWGCGQGDNIGVLLLCGEAEDWLVIFDLMGGHSGELLEVLGPGLCQRPWQIVVSSTEARFGGAGISGFDASAMRATFEAPEALVLRSSRPKVFSDPVG